MSVEQLPSGRWRARWKTADGRHPGRTFDSKTDAEAYDLEIKAERKRLRRQRVYTGHTFTELLYRHFERKIETEKWGKGTRRSYESSWRLIRADIGDVRVDHFRPRDAEQFQVRLLQKLRINAAQRHRLISADEAAVMLEKARHGGRGRWKFSVGELEVLAEMRASGHGVSMARRTMTLLGAALRTAELFEWVDRNVVSLIDKVPKKDYQVRVATPPVVGEAIRREFLRSNDTLSATLLSSMVLGGLRPEESLGLDRYASLERPVVKIFQANVDGHLAPTKNRRNRTLEPTPQFHDDLEAWLSSRPGVLVFERDGRPWTASNYANWRENVYRPVVERVLGERIPPYELGRHVFIALLLAEGRPLHEIAKEAGHSVAVLSEHYALVIPEFRSKPPIPAARAIDEVRKMSDAEIAKELAEWRKRRGTWTPALQESSTTDGEATEADRNDRAGGRIPPKKAVDKPATRAPKPDRVSALAAAVAAHPELFPLTIFATYRGHRIEATVEQPGVIRFGSETFSSPSTAANAARKLQGYVPAGRVATNGWRFWRFTRDDGEPRLLDDLRPGGS